MKFIDYLKDKVVHIFLNIIMIGLIIVLLNIFNTKLILIIYIISITLITNILLLYYNFYRKKHFYNTLEKSLNNLDQKYLINEVIEEPDFLEGKILYNYLYEINKSMIEYLNKYRNDNVDFREYIELWCHEIKTPIATSKMIYENNKNNITNDINDEVIKIESLVEQVMYYSRSGSVEKDYIIKKISLNEVINNVIKKNKKLLISKKIKIELQNLDTFVDSDSKWLEFIINQIITNSIKYSSLNPIIKISSQEFKNNIILTIYDNGIGINKNEIDNIFDKCFTGSNGRINYASTGIGLYLCKKLCDKLNHKITAESILNEYTLINIIFPINSMIKGNIYKIR